jgi:hypothetical protein
MMWVRSAYDATRFLLNRRPNKRLKLAAPSRYGSLLFVKSSSSRRSLGAFR